MSKLDRINKRTPGSLLPALLAVSGGLAAGPAGALELGDIRVQSKLGQPLRASIAYALGPNEQLQRYCVSTAAAPQSGLPTVSNTRVDIADGIITLTGSAAVREPMIALQLSVNCPYTPQLTREYMMFLDPPGLAAAPATAAAARTQPAPRREQPPATAAPSAASASRAVVRDIVKGSSHRVRAGETLSGIAERIEDRRVGLWPAVNVLFDSNPDAFLDQDINKLKAGSVLIIPESLGSRVAAGSSAPAAAPAATGNQPATSTAATYDAAYSDAPAIDSAPAENAANAANAGDATAIEAPLNTERSAAPAERAATEPSAEPVAIAEPPETVVIPDTRLSPPQTNAETPNRSVARIQPQAQPQPAAEAGGSWLPFAAGGLGLVIVLLLFGGRLRERFGSTPVGAAATPQRRSSDAFDSADEGTIEVEELSDDSPTDRNLALDASVDFGHDLDGEVDVDFGQDFGQAGATKLDLELPEATDADSETSETDVIPAQRAENVSILESEVLPDDDDYDMSVIMDMTKQPVPEEVTVKDLHAVEVPDTGDSDDDSYTMNDEADYDILEQDYQDELSATQALNMEIEKAARDLEERLVADEDDDADATTNAHIGDMSEMEITSELPAQNDQELSDLDDTNVNEALQLPDDDDTARLAAEDKTAEMVAAEDATVEMPTDDATVEMERKAAEDNVDVITSDGDRTVEIVTRDDDTVEMEVEGGRVDTKNTKIG